MKGNALASSMMFITHIHAVKCAFEIQKDGPTVSLGGVHLSMFIQMHSPDNICQES
jgi:flavorubredoxin